MEISTLLRPAGFNYGIPLRKELLMYNGYGLGVEVATNVCSSEDTTGARADCTGTKYAAKMHSVDESWLGELQR